MMAASAPSSSGGEPDPNSTNLRPPGSSRSITDKMLFHVCYLLCVAPPLIIFIEGGGGGGGGGAGEGEISAAICGGLHRHKSPLHFIQHTDLPACV